MRAQVAAVVRVHEKNADVALGRGGEALETTARGAHSSETRPLKSRALRRALAGGNVKCAAIISAVVVVLLLMLLLLFFSVCRGLNCVGIRHRGADGGGY